MTRRNAGDRFRDRLAKSRIAEEHAPDPCSIAGMDRIEIEHRLRFRAERIKYLDAQVAVLEDENRMLRNKALGRSEWTRGAGVSEW